MESPDPDQLLALGWYGKDRLVLGKPMEVGGREPSKVVFCVGIIKMPRLNPNDQTYDPE